MLFEFPPLDSLQSQFDMTEGRANEGGDESRGWGAEGMSVTVGEPQKNSLQPSLTIFLRKIYVSSTKLNITIHVLIKSAAYYTSSNHQSLKILYVSL